MNWHGTYDGMARTTPANHHHVHDLAVHNCYDGRSVAYLLRHTTDI